MSKGAANLHSNGNLAPVLIVMDSHISQLDMQVEKTGLKQPGKTLFELHIIIAYQKPHGHT